MTSSVQVPSSNQLDLDAILQQLRCLGFAVVPDFVPERLLRDFRERLPVAYASMRDSVPADRLAASGERGVLRLPMLFDEHFLEVLELPHLLAIVDATTGPMSVLHVQNCFLTPPREGREANAFQERFHMDFPRVIGRALLSINIFVALDAFTAENGATQVVPGTHQHEAAPSSGYLEAHAQNVTCPAGTAIVFDSTLWHRGGWNRSDSVRMAMNLQFTKSYVRQQIDYPRALPTRLTDKLPERTRQLLGFYVRMPTSLAEYYVPPEQRLYRAGQG